MVHKETIGNATLYLGDCLEILPTLEAGSVDAVITDPPYCSGARTAAAVRGAGDSGNKYARGKRWAARPLHCDQMTSVGFVWLIRQLAICSRRLLVQGGSLLSFIDWRQYPNAYGAIESANLRIQALVVWDKQHMALGNGFRKRHELIIHAAKGVPAVYNRSVSDVQVCPRISASDLHPTEKPVALLESLMSVVCPLGGMVCDPMTGSGSAGVAALHSGRKFIGIEIDPKYFDIACRRIGHAMTGGPLLAEAEA